MRCGGAPFLVTSRPDSASSGRSVEDVGVEAYSISAAVDNLVRNAVVHTPPGTEVRVDLDRMRSGAIQIRVSDDGPGVSAELAARMFEPCVRQSDDGHDGSGIGLELVKRAVEAHHGTVAASASTDGPGLVMSITLPAEEHAR